MVEFGKTLREKRTRLGLTQGQLGDKVGVSHSAISRFEDGDKAPSAETAAGLVARLIETASGCKVLELACTGETEDGRLLYEVVLSHGSESMPIPLEGRQRLAREKGLYRRLVKTKEEQLAILADLLDVATKEITRVPWVVRQIARFVQEGSSDPGVRAIGQAIEALKKGKP